MLSAFSATQLSQISPSLELQNPTKSPSIPQELSSLFGTTMLISECITPMARLSALTVLSNRSSVFSGRKTTRPFCWHTQGKSIRRLMIPRARRSGRTTSSRLWIFLPKRKFSNSTTLLSTKFRTWLSAQWALCTSSTWIQSLKQPSSPHWIRPYLATRLQSTPTISNTSTLSRRTP